MGYQQGLRHWLEDNIPNYLVESKIPGFSIAVVKDGATIYAEGFGLRDPDRSLPATPDTLYGIGSLTKSFVAIGILQLIEAGKVNLGDPVAKHVPLKLGIQTEPITLHHLLTHSCGIPNLATSDVVIRRGLGLDTGIPLGSDKDFYRFVNGAQAELVAKPGERFLYNNAGWRMLGHIIQAKSGLPLDRYLQERAINPLGMPRTTFDVDQFESDSNRIVPQRKTSNDTNQSSKFPYPNPIDNPEFSFFASAGGIFSSVNEMAIYLNAQIEMGQYNSEQLATQESFEKMQTLQILMPEGYYGQTGYGYGLQVTPHFLGHKMLAHGGSVLVSTAYMAFIPEIKAGVVMMGNSSGIPYSTIAQSVFALMLNKVPIQVIPALRIKDKMMRLTGTYQTYRGLETIHVVNQRGMLYTEYRSPLTPATSLTPLIPEDPALDSTVFYTLSNGLKSPVEFKIGDTGSIDLIMGRHCFHKIGLGG